MKEIVLTHPDLLESSSSSLGRGFSQTKGFIFRFSKYGIKQLRKEKKAKGFLPFFDAARDESCNAFVLNVLCCCPSKKEDDDDNVDDYSVGWHFDATLALTEVRKLVDTQQRMSVSDL